MTTNEMIFKTISTKTTKVAKFAPILIDMGYEVIDDNGWNGCDCFIVRNPKTNKSICFSKGYDNKRRLFDTCFAIETYDFKKVDFVRFLSKPRRDTYEKPSIYSQFRAKYKNAKWDNEYHGDKIISIRKQIEKLQKELEYHIENRDSALETIWEVKDFILENM